MASEKFKPIPAASIVVSAPRDFRDWPPEEMRAKGAMAHLYRKVYGPAGAQWIMPLLGFPTPPKRLWRHGAQLTLLLDG